MKKLITICAVVTMVLAASPAQASVTFNFEGATLVGTSTEANQRVSDYMTGVYGSSVTGTDGWVINNALSGVDWLGNDGQWLRTRAEGAVPWDFEISFDTVPITSASGDFYVFVGTDADFTITAYDSSYGDRETPSASALVTSQSWNPGTGAWEGSFDLSFGSPVSLLVFSDGGYDDVAIDDLTVTPIPAPGAILLGSIGVGLVGWLRRRRTL